MIDRKDLKELIKLMIENDLTELDLQDRQGERVTLKRGSGSPTVQYIPGMGSAPMVGPGMVGPGVVSAHGGGVGHGGHTASGIPAAVAVGAATGAAGGAGGGNEGLTPITSPMVGTFYSAATPDAKPFVNVGDRVNADTVVCIIEAMKVFNEIKAEVSGTIEKVMVTNGKAVEFGQPIYMVKP